MKKRKIIINIFYTSLVLSLFLHVIFGLTLIRWPDSKKAIDENSQDYIVMEFEAPKNRMQIVDQNEKSLNNEAPKNSKFLSHQNQRVEKETRAKNRGEFNNKAGQGVAAVAQRPSGSPDKSKTSKIVTASNGLPTLNALKPNFDWNELGEKNQKRTVQVSGQPSATDDYLKDVEEGVQTVLNTKEFMYFTYYSRIKKQIRQFWEPKIKEKIKNILAQGRKLASVDRVTRLLIVLNNEGTLVAVKIVDPSGEIELDQAAIEAFKAAAPFPNPPDGLVENDGTVKIRWDFILEA
ncbi:MAG: energy transducer TonB [Bdellovibrionales bacterium]|nr:energy transducer TonB [Bdellovibrionales bacterium]